MEQDTYAIIVRGVEHPLCDETNALINARLATGEYASADECIHAALNQAMLDDSSNTNQ